MSHLSHHRRCRLGARMVERVNGEEGSKKAAQEEATGRQEMEELSREHQTVRPYQAYSILPPGVGLSCGHDPSR